jgi:hypothetical protein
MRHLKPKPQGNAMFSVRITAAGAVFLCCVSFLTAPARACDDRYFKTCEKAAADQAAAEDSTSVSGVRRGKRVKVVAARQSRHARLRHRQAPRFASRITRRVALDGSERRMPDTPMARRFRGFIDPQPMAQNAFEALRKPHLVSLDFDSGALLPVVDVAEAAAIGPAQTPPARSATTTTSKQDRLVARPASLMELASAESRPVTLPPAPAKAALPEPAAAPAVVTAAPTEPPSKLSFHGLVLALCGALGAASALRFIVRV